MTLLRQCSYSASIVGIFTLEDIYINQILDKDNNNHNGHSYNTLKFVKHFTYMISSESYNSPLSQPHFRDKKTEAPRS